MIMADFKEELINGIEAVIRLLSVASRRDDHELCIVRLEILGESAMTHDGIPLEAVDLLIQALNTIKSRLGHEAEMNYAPYVAPTTSNDGRRGRPKFAISEEQLWFFKGLYNVMCEYIYTCPQNIQLHIDYTSRVFTIVVFSQRLRSRQNRHTMSSRSLPQRLLQHIAALEAFKKHKCPAGRGCKYLPTCTTFRSCNLRKTLCILRSPTPAAAIR